VADQSEPILEPDLPIIDAHHHLWYRSPAFVAQMKGARAGIIPPMLAPTFIRHARYLFDEFMADVKTGHNIRASVFVDARLMYRRSGPEAMKSVGETEFVNGVAAMGASENFDGIKLCAGIIGGGIDLGMGDGLEEVLAAHVRAGNGRYRGLRQHVAHNPDPEVLGNVHGRPHMLLEEKFRVGFRQLNAFGLCFDAHVHEHQLPDVIDLARSFPETSIVLEHVGTPVGVGKLAGPRAERFETWRRNIQTLAGCSNASVKLGGLGMPFSGFRNPLKDPPGTSAELADEWRPYIETWIEAFGVNRAMFESNFPVDSMSCSYPVLWNAFKRITRGASNDEKHALYYCTAERIYGLDLS
jgi:predicted TIM-barrel fold metal-dependent hydrolase